MPAAPTASALTSRPLLALAALCLAALPLAGVGQQDDAGSTAGTHTDSPADDNSSSSSNTDTAASTDTDTDTDAGDPRPVDSRVEESMIAFAQGMALLKGGRADLAVERFKEAVTLKPDDGNYRFQLAEAYGETDRMMNRWFQLRQAVRLRPDLAEAVQAFSQMWQTAAQQGVLDVGTPSDTVRQALGEPDLIDEEPQALVWQYGYMAASFADDRLISVLDLRGLDEYRPPRSELQIQLDPAVWRLTYHQLSRAAHRREYRRVEPDSPPADGALVTLERLIGLRRQLPPRELAETMHDNLQQRFPDVRWDMLNESDDDLLFEWALSGDGKPTQHELVRLLAVDEDIYRFAYTATSGAGRDTALQLLRSAAVAPRSAGE